MRDFSGLERIVVKIGTNTLAKNGGIDVDYIHSVAVDVSSLVKLGKEIIIVTSGAIGAGCMTIGLHEKPTDVTMRQSMAAIGQPKLLVEYGTAFAQHGVNVAQALLTYDVFRNRKSFKNFHNCVEGLLAMHVVPILNENDVVSTAEIGNHFGDNDRLSALVATKLHADLLLLLTDVDGLYTGNPKTDKDARKITVVTEITREIRRYAGKPITAYSTGGMATKVNAAGIAMRAGCYTVIEHGRTDHVIPRVIAGEELGSLFVPIAYQ